MGRNHIVVDIVAIVHGITEEFPATWGQLANAMIEPFCLGHLIGEYQWDQGAGVSAALLEFPKTWLAKVTWEPPDVQIVDLLMYGHPGCSRCSRCPGWRWCVCVRVVVLVVSSWRCWRVCACVIGYGARRDCESLKIRLRLSLAGKWEREREASLPCAVPGVCRSAAVT